ncbi:MAG TPA: WYL domain-containing protein [Gaiellaceae bacterium]
MSHDTDKLIRQLSLVAYLMAERRPITARDVKTNVEGYSEMSDEAFARRFYSDRSELIALGVPLHSQRDEFTGEELYTLRSEQYFLPALQLEDDELAALQTALHLLDGRFAYAEPLRLALQNLALGRGGPLESTREAAVQVRDPEYSEEMSGRLTKLEGAISKGRTVKFSYEPIDGKAGERTVNPYALFSENGSWYVVGWDQGRKDMRTFRASRIRGDIRFATRRERDFRIPEDFDPGEFRGLAPWQRGEIAGEARIELSDDLAWLVERAFSDRSRVEGTTFVTPYARLDMLAGWILSHERRARPLEPPELVRLVDRSVKQVVAAHRGRPPEPARERRPRSGGAVADRTAGPVAPERFGLLQALLAYLLARCGDEVSADFPAEELTERFHIPADQLDEHLQLLNLVNFGGGCYALYASLDNGSVHVEKELFGDTFRRPPRLTPLEARAIRLALEFVGPMIAAEAHTPLDRVRRKLEETFGQFELDEGADSSPDTEEERLIRTLSEAIRQHRVVEFEYLKPGETAATTRQVEPYRFRRELPFWYVDVWDRNRKDVRSFRLDRMRQATKLKETFEPRPGIAPTGLEDAQTARVLFSPTVARRRIERGAARPLADGSAIEDIRVGSIDWLVGEILSHLGEAVVLEPTDLRKQIAERAKAAGVELRAAPAGSKS